MYQGNLSEDEYGTQQFLADLRFESVTVEIDPDTNDLYNIESNHYGFSRIQYQCSVIDWLLRELLDKLSLCTCTVPNSLE